MKFALGWQPGSSQRIVLLVALVGYIVSLFILFPVGGPAAGLVAAVFVVIVGWMLGSRAALIAGVLVIPVHVSLAMVFEDDTLGYLARTWPGFVTVMFVGMAVGRLHDLQRARDRELIERKRAESHLKTLNMLLHAIGRGGSREQIATALVEQIGRLLPVVCATVVAVDDSPRSQPTLLATFYSGEWPEADRPDDALLAQAAAVNAPDVGELSLEWLRAPLSTGGVRRGVLAVASRPAGALSDDQRQILRDIADPLAIVLESTRLQAAEQRYLAELEALRIASLQLTSKLDLQDVFATVLDSTLRLTGAIGAHIFLYDGERLTFGSALWDGRIQEKPLNEPRPDGLTMSVARTGERVVVSDASNHPLYRGSEWDGAIVGLPLFVDRQVRGVMTQAFLSSHNLGNSEIRLLELFADQAAIAISNAQLYEHIRDQNEDLERRVAERTSQLEALNTRLETILNTSSDAIILVGADGHVRQTNETHQSWFGSVASGEPMDWTMVATDDRVRLVDAFARVLATGSNARLEIVADTVAGDRLALDLALAPVGHSSAEPAVVFSFRDVTARRRAEASQQTLVQGLRDVVTSAYELLGCANVDALYRHAVELALTRLGLDRCALYVVKGENMQGTYGTDRHGRITDEHANVARIDTMTWAGRLNNLHTSRVEWINDYVPLLEWDGKQTVQIGVEAWNVVTPIFAPQGLVGFLFNDPGLSGRPLDPATQEIIFLYCALLGHILVRKQLEEDLRNTLQKEKDLNALKSRFVAMVSHEFRTPLAVIQSSSDLIKYYSERLGEERRGEHIAVIHEQIQHLTQLLDDILAIGRTENAADALQPRPVDLEGMIQNVIKDVLVSQPERPVTFDVSGDVRVLMLDPKLFRQVVSNLLTNAVKYSPLDAPIEVGLAFAVNTVTLTVQDRGIGIPDEDREHIFDLFHRAQNAELVPGTGLGLTIVKRVVDLHQGTVTCDSSRDEGTRFTVTLPISSEQEADRTLYGA